jgi:S-methylmethionine-dependent homocysteine/selenocysteine methylase
VPDLTRSCLWARAASEDADDEARASLGRILTGSDPSCLVFEGPVEPLLADLPLSETVPLPLWSLDEPETLDHIHQLFHDAGADVALTGTDAMTRLGLDAVGLGVRVRDVVRACCRSARSCGPRFVMGQVGPCGAPTHARARGFYLELAEALAEGGVHGFLVSSMRSSADAECVLSTLPFGYPSCASFTCDADGRLADSGESIEEAFLSVARAGADAVGVDGVDAGVVADLADRIADGARACGRRAVVRTSLGEGVQGGEESERDQSLATFDDVARLLASKGVLLQGASGSATLAATATVATAVL